MHSAGPTTPDIEKESPFETGQVLTIVSGHTIHDTYTAFLAPLLPKIIASLSLSLTQVGWLTAIQQLPAILNPFIGYLADKISLRYFVILAPAVTATLMSVIGLSPSYLALVFLLFLSGISTAAFHAPAPAMIARISGRRVGVGMSLFMAGGELGRTVGPLVAVWAVSLWGLDGIYRLMVIGWASSIILLVRLRRVSGREYRAKPTGLEKIKPKLKTFFLPLLLVIQPRAYLTDSLTTYMPTFLTSEGATLFLAGASLSIIEIAGVAGALLSGTVSDHVGRKPTLLIAITASTLLTFVFLQVEGWLIIPVLLLLGFVSISTQPVFLALVQDNVPENRAVGNGLFMSMSFLVRSVALLLLGIAGDIWGLRTTFYAGALISLLAIPAILALPAGSAPESVEVVEQRE